MAERHVTAAGQWRAGGAPLRLPGGWARPGNSKFDPRATVGLALRLGRGGEGRPELLVPPPGAQRPPAVVPAL